VSEDTNLNAGSTSSAAVGFSRRTITLIVAAVISLAACVLLMNGGSNGGTIAHAQETTITAKALTDHECNSTEWHFVITGVTAANAPQSIEVTWANDDTETVPLLRVTGGVAHYVTTSNLDSTVVSATAVIFAGWSGQFNLSHGPCGPTTPPTTTAPPTTMPPTS
jgi:hypothetical protein